MAKAKETVEMEMENEPAVQENVKKRVRVSLPRGTKSAQYVGVNGVAYLIPAKGEHDVPAEVAAELARSQAAEDERDRNQAAMQNAAAAAYANVARQIV